MVSTPSRPDVLAADRSRGLRVGPTALPAARPSILGVVAFATHRGEPAEAILDSAGAWACPRLPVLNRVLNALFAPDRGGPSPLPFGHRELARVAAWINGEVRPPLGPG